MLTPFIRVHGVSKDYGGLRPLRIEDLAVAPGEIVAVQGPDETAAAVLVDLVTGTTLPDKGEIKVADVATSAVADHDAWLAFVEQFGIVNPRVVLLDDLSVLQNLAVPLTLDLDPLPEDLRQRAEKLAASVGLTGPDLLARLADTPPLARFRLRLGRAIAHGPRALLLEHPTLGLADEDVESVAAVLRAVVRDGALATLVVSNDARLARRAATRALTWTPATGRLAEGGGWRGWFGSA